MFLLLSRLVCISAIGCFIAALLLPWFLVEVRKETDFRQVQVAIIKTNSKLSAPSLSVFAAPTVAATAASIVALPCKRFAWVGGIIVVAAGAIGIGLQFAFSQQVANWTLSQDETEEGRQIGWWFSIAASIAAAVSGVLAICSVTHRQKNSDLASCRATSGYPEDMESIEIVSPVKHGQQKKWCAKTTEKDTFVPSYEFTVTPVFDKKRRDWYAASSNPLFGEATVSRPSFRSNDFIPAMHPVPPLASLENLQEKEEVQWASGSESLREKYGRSRRNTPFSSEDGARSSK